MTELTQSTMNNQAANMNMENDSEATMNMNMNMKVSSFMCLATLLSAVHDFTSWSIQKY